MYDRPLPSQLRESIQDAFLDRTEGRRVKFQTVSIAQGSLEEKKGYDCQSMYVRR